MKRFLQLLCLVPTLAWGMTIESDDPASILPHLTPDTLVVFDVDDTLVRATGHLGSRQWRNHIRSKLRAAGYVDEEVEEHLLRFWLFVRPYCPHALLDETIVSLIAQLPNTLACTRRHPVEADATEEDLASFNIRFTAPNESFPLPCPHPALYKNGVIYAGANPKSVALQAYLTLRGTKPTSLILLDDQWYNINDLEAANLTDNYVGIRYSAIDARVAAFDPQIADLQWSTLPAYLSDEEAAARLERQLQK
jgi:hypothetical protein